MNARRFTLLLVALLSLAFAPAPFPRADRRPKTDPTMEGMWYGGHRLSITSTHLTYNPGSGAAAYEVRINRSVRPPTYDLHFQGQANASWLGIWRVEGDTLTLCYKGAQQGRPAAFEGSGGIIEIYKRTPR